MIRAIAIAAACVGCLGASLVFQPVGSPEVAPGGSLAVDIWVVGRQGERIAGVSLLLQDARRTGWFSISANLNRVGSPLCEPVAPPGYHPWPQLLGGPDGVNGYDDGAGWRGVDLGGVHPDAPWCWVAGEIPIGRAELLVSPQARPGAYQIGADSILTGWCDAGLSERAFDCVTPLSLSIIPEPHSLLLVSIGLLVIAVVRFLLRHN